MVCNISSLELRNLMQYSRLDLHLGDLQKKDP